MDQPGLNPEAHVAALNGLSRVNRWSRTGAAIWKRIRPHARNGRAFRVIDIACGGGDVCVDLARRAARAGVLLEVVGSDISPVALDYARRQAQSDGVTVDFHLADVLRGPLPPNPDCIISTLFLHHLTEEEAVTLLTKMRDSGAKILIISDLLRSRAGLALAYLATHLLSHSWVVRVDGPLSVRAAFTIPEAHALTDRAGLRGARIKSCWPCRFLLEWTRS